MLFTELRFLVLFALVFGAYWSLPWERARKGLLLLASYTFYAAWDYRFLSLIVFSTALDYGVALALGRTAAPRGRRLLLALSLLGNLGLLGFFKYYNFFVESGTAFLGALGLAFPAHTLAIVLPVGISFYTFQTLSYTIDVYRRRMAPAPSALDFAVFVAFFPQLVAGPIVRACDFLPQLVERRRFAEVEVRACCALFLAGFIKKACLSDNLGPIVDPIFADPARFATGAKWLGVSLYTLQIYCDFSGYSDMAIASAGLLGYRLNTNFAFPYLAGSVSEFWRRWHISLSTWFRDYLYVPLGGNRSGGLGTLRNLVVVFFLCGLWHGASWSFVVWGLYHGLFLVLERLPAGTRMHAPPRIVKHAYTLLVVMVGWVLFRSASLALAGEHLAGLLGFHAGPRAIPGAPLYWGLVAGFVLVHVALGNRLGERHLRALPDWAFALGYGAALALVLPWVATEYAPFIYFQF